MPTNKLNYGEWGEIYALLQLVYRGEIRQADENEHAIDGYGLVINEVIRRETTDREVVYRLPGVGQRADVDIFVNHAFVKSVAQSRFGEMAGRLLEFVKRGLRAPFSIPQDMQAFLDEIEVAHYKAPASDKSDIFLSVIDPRTANVRNSIGYSIKTKWSQKATLFNTGPGSRAIFEVNGALTAGERNHVNSLRDDKGHADVLGRVDFLYGCGCTLEFEGYGYCERARCRAFQENLSLLNPRLVQVWQAVMLEHFENGSFTGGGAGMSSISDWLVETNPCNIERGEVHYPYMIKSFLYAAYCGLTASTLWDGRSNVNGGLLTIDNEGDILAFSALESDAFKSYLYNHTCIDYPSTSRGHGNYGSVYEEDGKNYFALNFQIRFKSY